MRGTRGVESVAHSRGVRGSQGARGLAVVIGLLIASPTACGSPGGDSGVGADALLEDAGESTDAAAPLTGLPELPLDTEAKIAAALSAARVELDGYGPSTFPIAALGVLGPEMDTPAVHTLLADDAAALAATIWSHEDRVESFSLWQLWSPDVELFRFWIAPGLLTPATAVVDTNNLLTGVPGSFAMLTSAPPVGVAGILAISAFGPFRVELYEPPTPGNWGRLRGRLEDVALGLLDQPAHGNADQTSITPGSINGLIDVPLVSPSDLVLPPRETALGMTLVAEVPIDAADADIWGAGDLAFVAANSLTAGGPTFHVLDFGSGPNPTPVTVSGSGQGKDLKYDAGYLFVGVQPNPDSVGGVRIYDMVDPSAPAEVAFITSADLSTRGVHNLFVDGGFVYATAGSHGVEIWDVADPANPVFAGEWDVLQGFSGSAHDLVVVGPRLYLSGWGGGLYILDISNPGNPTLLSHVTYPDMLTHNAWPTVDGNHVLVTDEYIGGVVRVFDISDLADVVEVTSFAPPRRNAIVHNVFVVGDAATVSYYLDGVEVWDVADPTDPVRDAYYRTIGDVPPDMIYVNEGNLGVWGVWPFGGGDRIYVSDSFRGVLKLSRP